MTPHDDSDGSAALRERFQDYLGDGVYAEFDGYHIWLSAERDGFTHRIAIEAQVLDSLVSYALRVRAGFAPPVGKPPAPEPPPATDVPFE